MILWKYDNKWWVDNTKDHGAFLDEVDPIISISGRKFKIIRNDTGKYNNLTMEDVLVFVLIADPDWDRLV